MGYFMVPSPGVVDIHLEWDPNVEPEGDLAGYRIYVGTAIPWGTDMELLDDVGNVTSHTVTMPKRMYCFALKAYDTFNIESLTFSNVVVFTP